ncbi:MAG: hypothetical protein LBC59_03980 [Chitinispirillales bacterium]|nr:hypothetical protein [Chitinispirillales bacterium]
MPNSPPLWAFYRVFSPFSKIPSSRTPLARLFDARFFGSGARSVLRVTIDKAGGVTVADCERVSSVVGGKRTTRGRVAPHNRAATGRLPQKSLTLVHLITPSLSSEYWHAVICPPPERLLYSNL